jgi:hypothetical protein
LQKKETLPLLFFPEPEILHRLLGLPLEPYILSMNKENTDNDL